MSGRRCTPSPPDPAVPDKPADNLYRFNGKRRDPVTGSYDMGFRDYNPGLNRFLTLVVSDAATCAAGLPLAATGVGPLSGRVRGGDQHHLQGRLRRRFGHQDRLSGHRRRHLDQPRHLRVHPRIDYTEGDADRPGRWRRWSRTRSSSSGTTTPTPSASSGTRGGPRLLRLTPADERGSSGASLTGQLRRAGGGGIAFRPEGPSR